MKLTDRQWLVLAFLVSVFAAGIPFWVIPYSRVGLPGDLVTPGLMVVVLAAMALCAYGVARFWPVVRVIGCAVPAAVMLRVIVEGVMDPTRHNLWPFEMVIALMIGIPCALLGAGLGWLMAPPPGRGRSVGR